MKNKYASRQLLLLTAATGALLGVQRPAAATTFTVNETVDALNDNNLCSLREAIVAANSNRTTNACGKGQPSSIAVDKIVLPAGSTFAISDIFTIKDGVNITTNSGRATIRPSTTKLDTPGFVLMPEAIRVELHNLDLMSFKNPPIALREFSQAKVFDVTIQNGFSVGTSLQTGSIQVDKDANLQLTRVEVRNQQMSIRGGALLAYGSVTMGDCSFSNNRAQQYGGAINVQPGGSVFCKRSTITNNVAEVAGGGVAIGVDGTFTQNDCVVSGNSAPISPDIHRF